MSKRCTNVVHFMSKLGKQNSKLSRTLLKYEMAHSHTHTHTHIE